MSKKYNIVFCGTPQIAVDILKAVEKIDQINIVAVITQPDKVVGRKQEVVFSEVKQHCLEKKYKLFQPIKIGQIYDQLKELNAEFLITCAFGQFIPEKILNLYKNCINVHASLLPKYRGGSPIQYSLLNGDSQTGISLMQMVKQMDAGKVYVQESIEIDQDINNGQLFEKMGQLGAKMIEKYLIDIFENKLIGEEQDSNQVTFAYNLTNEQEKIDWNKPAVQIHNFIRALSPKPIAFCFLEGKRIKIKSSRIVKDDEHFIAPRRLFVPGEVIYVDKEGIIVTTVQGYLKILELQVEGKKMVLASTFFNQSNGFIKMGSKFE